MEGSTSQESSHAPTNSVSSDERKLWLDYLRSINERQSQSAQKSGLTNYVLLAIFASLLYRFVPQIPAFLAQPAALRSSLIALALEMDVLLWFVTAYGLLLQYCGQEREHRTLPEVKRRLADVELGIIVLLLLALSMFHLWIGVRFNYSSSLVRVSILIFGIVWSILILGVVVNEFRIYRRARLHNIPRPRFTTKGLPPPFKLIGALVGGVISIYGLVVFVRYLITAYEDWVRPVGAASIFLAALIVCGELLFRGLDEAMQSTYEMLEREILFDAISPEEIRSKFIRYSLGPDTKEWLDEISAGLLAEAEEIQKICTSSQGRLEEIAAIDAGYSIERAERSKKVLNELTSCTDRFKLKLQGFKVQVDLYFTELYMTPKEKEVVDRWTKDFQRRMEEVKKTAERVSELRTQANALATGQK